MFSVPNWWWWGPHSWHNSISMSLLENNGVCKDGGGIHYQQLGWNDNMHYTPISLHKAVNGFDHSTLINKTLSFVSTWTASSVFHWDSHSWARQHGSNSLTAGGTISIALPCVGMQTCKYSNEKEQSVWFLFPSAPRHKMSHPIGADRTADQLLMNQWSLCQVLSKPTTQTSPHVRCIFNDREHVLEEEIMRHFSYED